MYRTISFILTALLLTLAFVPAVTSADNPNLITNPSFENGSTGWAGVTQTGDTAAFTYPVVGFDGLHAAQVTVTKYKSGDIFWQPTNAKVTAGQTYTFSGYSLNSVPVDVVATYLNASNKAVSYATLGTVPASGSWQQFSSTFTAPAKVTQVRIQHVIRAVGTLDVDQYSLTLGTTTGGTGTTTPPNNPPPATISSFTANPTTVVVGQSSTLSWSLTNTASFVVMNGTTVVAQSGTSVVVSPIATTTYTLFAYNGGTATTSATLTVNVAPKVVTPLPPPPAPTCTISASPTSITLGQSSTLTFSSTNASSSSIDQGIGSVAASGTKVVSPTATTSYTMTVANVTATSTCKVMVNVAPVAVVPPPTNLIPNGSLEAGSTNNPTGWNADFWGNLTAKFTYPVAGDGGGKAAQVQITQYKTGDAKWDSNHVTVSPNTIYTYSENYESNVGTSVTIEYTLTNGTFDYEWVKDVATSTSWSSFTIPIFVPSNAVSFTVLHTLSTVGTLTIDNAVLAAEQNDAFPQGMVTLSFDDGLLSQFQNAVPMLKTAGLNAGFYIITTEPSSGDDGYMTWAQIKTLKSEGFEIGGHTRTHPFLTTLTPTQLTNEVSGSYQDLVAQGITPKAFVYPFGDINTNVENTVKTAGYTIARGSYYGENSDMADHYDLEDIRLDTTSTLPNVEAQIDQTIANKRWLVFEIHDVLASGGDDYTITPSFLQSIVNYLKQKNADLVTLEQGSAFLH